LFVRPEFRLLYDLLIAEDKRAIVSGTPGIGKSSFGLYLLWRLVTDKKTVAYIYRKAGFDDLIFSNGAIVNCMDVNQRDVHSYVICDGHEPIDAMRNRGLT
jgi:broad-specificity NMP kinase